MIDVADLKPIQAIGPPPCLSRRHRRLFVGREYVLEGELFAACPCSRYRKPQKK